MSSVNKVILVGNLGADPELRHTQGGKVVCTLSVATSRRYTDAEGQRKEETDWHNVTAWGKTGELCRTYLKKGRKVYVEGRLKKSTYTDKDGIKRHWTEVVSNSVVFLGGGDKPRDLAALPPANEAMAAPAEKLPF